MNVTVTLIVQMFSFALLVWFMMRFLWRPLSGLLEERQKRIADGLAAAEKGRHDLELAEKRAAEILRETKTQAADIVSHAERRAAEIVDHAKGEAKVEAERIVIAARGEVEHERNRAREELRSAVAQLVVLAASKILEKEVDAKAHSRMLEKAIEQL